MVQQEPGTRGISWDTHSQQHQRELTWGQEDAGTGLGGVGRLAEPLRVSDLDVLCPAPGNRVRAGQWGALGWRGWQRVQHLLRACWGMWGEPAAGVLAPGAEGVPCQHTFPTAAVQAAVGKGHLDHCCVGGCIDKALQERTHWGQWDGLLHAPAFPGLCPPAHKQDLPQAGRAPSAPLAPAPALS